MGFPKALVTLVAMFTIRHTLAVPAEIGFTSYEVNAANTTDISIVGPYHQGRAPAFPSPTNLKRTGRFGEELEKHIRLAIDCLGEWCQSAEIQPKRKVRCTVGTGIAYVCNYGNHQPCSTQELHEVWAAIRGSTSITGMWDYSPWAKVMGMEAVTDGFVGFERMGSERGICSNVEHKHWQYDKVLPAPEEPAPPKNDTKPQLEDAYFPPSIEEVPEKKPHKRPLFNQASTTTTATTTKITKYPKM